MKFYVPIISIFFLLLCGANINAQMCGKYKVILVVLDERNKPINDADVQFLPMTKDETQGSEILESEKRPFFGL